MSKLFRGLEEEILKIEEEEKNENEIIEENKKIPSIIDAVKNVRSIHELTKIPKELMPTIIAVIFWFAILAGVNHLFVFFLEFSRRAIVDGKTFLAITFFVLYLVQGALSTYLRTFQENLKEKYRVLLDVHKAKTGCIILGVTDGKVKKNDDIMSRSVMTTNISAYINDLFNLRQSLATNIISIGMSFIAMIGAVVLIFKGQDIYFALAIFLIIILLYVLYNRLITNALKINKTLREKHRERRNQNSDNANDLVNQQFINEKHYQYLSKKYLESMKKYSRLSVLFAKLNVRENLFIEILSTIATIIIAVMFLAKAKWNISVDVFLEMISFNAIINSIINYEIRGIMEIAHMKEDVIEKVTEEQDFKLIMDTYDYEISRKLKKVKNDEIVVGPYKYTNESFSLTLESRLIFNKGKMVLLNGKSGTGKSTLIDIITGKRGNIGYDIKAISYHDNMILGSGNVLEEITFGEEVDQSKLIEVLKGTQAYDNLKEKGDKKCKSLIEYLSSIKRGDLSDGIEQRVFIARILYHLDSSTDLLLFDEPISAIDKATAIQLIAFVKDYCNRDKKRFLLLATHQYEWVRQYIDEEIVFKQISQTKTVIH